MSRLPFRRQVAPPKSDISLLVAPCYVKNLTTRELKQMFAYQADVVGPTEIYNRIPFLRRRRRYKMILGVSKTDKRRGPKDNPLLLRKDKAGPGGSYKATDKSFPHSIAPERWTTWGFYDGILFISVHPNAAVRNAPNSDRARKWRKQMNEVHALAAEHIRIGTPVVIFGDMQMDENDNLDWGVKQIFNELQMNFWSHQFTWCAWTKDLNRNSVHTIKNNGQNHPWALFHFKKK